MELLRGIMIGVGCLGLLIIGSCAMLGYGTMAVLETAVDAAEKEQGNPDAQAPRDEVVDRVVDRFVEKVEAGELEREYSASTDDNYSDYGSPSVNVNSNDQ